MSRNGTVGTYSMQIGDHLNVNGVARNRKVKFTCLISAAAASNGLVHVVSEPSEQFVIPKGSTLHRVTVKPLDKPETTGDTWKLLVKHADRTQTVPGTWDTPFVATNFCLYQITGRLPIAVLHPVIEDKGTDIFTEGDTFAPTLNGYPSIMADGSKFAFTTNTAIASGDLLFGFLDASGVVDTSTATFECSAGATIARYLEITLWIELPGEPAV